MSFKSNVIFKNQNLILTRCSNKLTSSKYFILEYKGLEVALIYYGESENLKMKEARDIILNLVDIYLFK